MRMEETYVWLGCAELELNNTNLRFLHTCRAACRIDDVLVEDDTIN